ncbi:MAG: hypothetical protein KDB03_09630 [Planctomycetales bacterium]|nr:hypothetical protein [Planctomycetales bacterium]
MISIRYGLANQYGFFAQSRISYQWERIEQLDQWWHWLLLAATCFCISLFVSLWYKRDCQELRRPVAWTLILLRLSAFGGLLMYFGQLDKRSEQRLTRSSRVSVLVDTSLSMTLPGTPTASGIPSQWSRSSEAARLLGESPFLTELNRDHEIAIYRFDQTARPVQLAALPQSVQRQSESTNPPDEATFQQAHQRFLLAVIFLVLGIALMLIALAAQALGLASWAPGSWLLFSGATATLVGVGALAYAILPFSQFTVRGLITGSGEMMISPDEMAASEETKQVLGNAQLPTDWMEAIQPSGVETRLGDAIKSVLDRELGNPLAGIVILTDGRNNAGIEPVAVLPAAQNARVPLFVVGLGSDRNPRNIGIAELDLPKRLYPGDRFSLSALIASSGFEGQSITIQVLSGSKDKGIDELAIEAEQQVQIESDGTLTKAEFQLQPKAIGQWQYAVKLIPLSEDADSQDNVSIANAEVIERKNRVLIIAGGPMRDYQFVRNLMFRDRDVESHVLLQTSSELTSQESQQLLTEFPADRSSLSKYDAILSFDADWTKIPDSSVIALEQWVAEQAGGLLIVAGSVEMPKWMSRSADGPRSQALRSLCPVVLEQRGSSLLAAGRVEGDTPWPLVFTPDGQQTDFLWLAEDAQTSQEIWQSFEGVHGFYSAYELKPGAKALALFSDPTTAVDGQLPIYCASQFYGAGRVVYFGGSEFWRLRRQGDQFFDRLYTKLVRWISQGRLLLDSDRGILLVDREQALLGDQVVVRAVLKNERYEPLVQTEVVARLIDPANRNQPFVLRPMMDGSQPGVYTGQFPVLIAGDYNIQLQLGGIASNEILTTGVHAKVPTVEMQRAERNDGMLSQLAVDSGGQYWAGVESASQASQSGQAEIVSAIQPQDHVAFLPGAPDPVFQLRWLAWLMGWIATCLTLEWLIRRLHRLA